MAVPLWIVCLPWPSSFLVCMPGVMVVPPFWVWTLGGRGVTRLLFIQILYLYLLNPESLSFIITYYQFDPCAGAGILFLCHYKTLWRELIYCDLSSVCYGDEEHMLLLVSLKKLWASCWDCRNMFR